MRPPEASVFLLWGGALAAAMLFGRRSTSLGSPLAGDAAAQVTPHGQFGARRDGPPVHAHQGIDLVVPPRSHVLAVGDGQIVAAGPGLGRVVRKLVLDEPSRWDGGRRAITAVVYADLGEPLVAVGDRVRQGDPIALVWDHGFVHFAVKADLLGRETFVDPKLAGFKYRSAENA
jgi:murein DD-endopeptidase MepM/ murein hydrolase activator NlpD